MERLSPGKYRDPVWDNYNRRDGSGVLMEDFYNAYVKARYIKHVYIGFAYQKQSSSYINRRFLKAFRPILNVEDAFCANRFADHVIGFQGECESQILVYMPYLSAERILEELESRQPVLRYCIESGIKVTILEYASWHCGASLVEFATGPSGPWGKSYDKEARDEVFGVSTYWRQENLTAIFPPKRKDFPEVTRELPINVITVDYARPKTKTS